MPKSEPVQEPPLYLTVLTAFGWASMGVVFGLVYFISFPLQVYTNQSELNEAIDRKESPHVAPGEAYYFEGPVLRTKSWAPKRKQFVSGEAEQLRFEVGELNGWLESYFKPVKQGPGEDSGGLTIRPDVGNLAIVDAGRMYVNLPARLEVFGWQGEFVLSATGQFKSGSPARFKVERMYLNNARLPAVVGKQLLNRLVGAYRRTEEYGQIRQAWQRVESVELEEGALRLNLR
ncbi:MAG: hypothetical protein ACLFU4_08725 [Opitutales bacterium]